ncbi:MAG: hypothetical protein ACYC2O_06500 [Microthrixaceae bacterium]
MVRRKLATVVCGVVVVTGVGCGQNAAPTTTTTIDLADCEVERRTVETTIEAWRATYGTYPATLDDPVGEFMKGPPTWTWTYETVDGSFTLTGPC